MPADPPREEPAAQYYQRVGAVKFQCCVSDCGAEQRVYRNKEAFQRHWYRFHRALDLNDDIFQQCQHCRLLCAGELGIRRHRCRDPAPDNNSEDGANNEHIGADEQENVAVLDNADNMATAEEHQRLLGQFMTGLYHLHEAWQESFYECTNKLLNTMAGPDEEKVYTGTLALFILPGLISCYNANRKALERAVDLLRLIAASEDPASVIISKAKAATVTIQGQATEERQARGAVQALTAATEAMGKRTRLAAADRFARQLEEILQSADRAAPNNLRALTPQEASAVLTPLNPPHRSGRLDTLPDINEETPLGLEVTADMVLRGIRLLNKDSAPGASGWTNHLLRFMASQGTTEDNTSFGERVAKVFNKITDGSMIASTRWMWTRSRAVLLPKPGQEGYRPLGIGDAWYRLLMRVTYSTQYVQLGEKLVPHQLAVGVSGGCEIGARLAQLQFSSGNDFEDDWELAPAIVNVDVKNCFNEGAARLAFEKLLEWAPGLARLFHWTHVDGSALIWNSGDVVGRRAIGFRQGCPASTANASLALVDVVSRLKTALAEVEEQVRQERGYIGRDLRPGSVVCYADDANIFTTLGVAVRLAERIPDLYAVDGLRVATQKSIIISRRAGEAQLAQVWPEGWGMAVEGAKILGAPVGTDEFITGYLHRKIATIKPPYKALERIGNRLGMQLTMFCHNVEPDYIFRVVEPHLSRAAADQHDQQIDRSIALIAGLEPEFIGLRALRSLPLSQGGLGVYAHRARLEAGVTVSRARTYAFAEMHFPQLLATIRRDGTWPEVVIGGADGRDITGDLTAEIREQLSNISAPHEVATGAKKAVQAVDAAVVLDVLQRLSAAGETGRGSLAFYRSNMSKATGRWLRSFIGMEAGQGFLPDREYSNILRARLLAPLRDFHGVVPRDCPCCCNPQSGTREGRDIGPSHALGCRSLRPTLDARHDKVRDLIAAALKRHSPLQNVQVRIEERLTAEAGPAAAGRTMDIVVRADNGYIRYLDIAVVEPSGYAVMDYGAWNQELRAARHREQEKVDNFRSFATAVDPTTFVPLVFETSGRPGQSARDFFLASRLPGAVVRRLLEQISVTLARFGGRLIAEWRRGPAAAG
jgi:hypothetical protein